jgi:urea carboxylase-associated protein 2
MPPLDDLSPAACRRRYEALLATARGRAAVPPDIAPPGPIAANAIRLRETIPGGWYTTLKICRGDALRVTNTGGVPGVAALIWNADDPFERFNPADTLKVQWTTRLRAGLLLLSDMGRVLASVIADSDGLHDSLVGPGQPIEGRRNSRDNFLLAAGKHGLDARDVGPCVTLFAGITVAADGGLHWHQASGRTGAAIDLRAEMNLLVALSNCPHPLAPTADAVPGEIEAIVWTPPPPPPDDPCRIAGEEAMRAFENTARYFQ